MVITQTSKLSRNAALRREFTINDNFFAGANNNTNEMVHRDREPNSIPATGGDVTMSMLSEDDDGQFLQEKPMYVEAFASVGSSEIGDYSTHGVVIDLGEWLANIAVVGAPRYISSNHGLRVFQYFVATIRPFVKGAVVMKANWKFALDSIKNGSEISFGLSLRYRAFKTRLLLSPGYNDEELEEYEVL